MSLLFFSLMLLNTVSMSFICQVALLCPTSLSDGDMLETVYVIVSRYSITHEMLVLFCRFCGLLLSFYFYCTDFHSINR